MWKHLFASVLFFLPLIAIGQQQEGKQKRIRVRVLPVCLSFSGILPGDSVVNYFEQSFKNRGVQLISQEQLKIETDNAMRKLAEKVKEQKKDNQVAEDFMRIMSREHRYVANRLVIFYGVKPGSDSSVQSRVTWVSQGEPINFSRIEKNNEREIQLSNLGHLTVLQRTQAIVDSILLSRNLH